MIDVQKPRTGSRTLKIANHMSHAGLVAHISGQVNWFLGVILIDRQFHHCRETQDIDMVTHFRERFNLATVASGTFPWEETKRPMARCFVL